MSWFLEWELCSHCRKWSILSRSWTPRGCPSVVVRLRLVLVSRPVWRQHFQGLGLVSESTAFLLSLVSVSVELDLGFFVKTTGDHSFSEFFFQTASVWNSEIKIQSLLFWKCWCCHPAAIYVPKRGEDEGERRAPAAAAMSSSIIRFSYSNRKKHSAKCKATFTETAGMALAKMAWKQVCFIRRSILTGRSQSLF